MASQMVLRVVALFILLQLISVFFLWTLNPVSQRSESTFALFLAVDLVAFSMTSYVYRVEKRGSVVSRGLLGGGCCTIVILLLASILI